MQGQTFSRIICNFMTRIVAIPDFAKMWNVIFEHALLSLQLSIVLILHTQRKNLVVHTIRQQYSSLSA